MATADDSSVAPRRVRVERNIYRRPSGVYEVGFKDGAGRQRWRTVDGGITAARAARDELLVRRSRGERIASNARLRFGDAATQWLAGPVVDLRATTQACYRNAVEQHLIRRFDTHRLDRISPDDLAALVRELRTDGLAESTIVIVVGVVNRIYRYAARRLGWTGTNPVSLLLPSERPKPGQSTKRRLFERGELEQTIAAAGEPYSTLFTLAALTGARVSELLALRWANVSISDPEEAEVEFACQVDRRGNVRPTKTDGSVRTVPIPGELAAILSRHKDRARYSNPQDFVFCTCTGRPLGQRNVARALRQAQEKAIDGDGGPTFPVLRERGELGEPVLVPHGALPSMHSFRHTVASRALLAGESIEEVAFLLGHRDANVTRAVYVRELSDARRRTMRRSRMVAEFGDLLRAQNDE
ncbi:MAG TPA: site-specific integrase [Solirubrobacteraceae bacterium]|nr:site-specific integrase [Solirubrobacteraceae bacterium]